MVPRRCFLMTSSDFYSTTMRLTFVVLSQMSQEQLDICHEIPLHGNNFGDALSSPGLTSCLIF